jgi:hypothetical protein
LFFQGYGEASIDRQALHITAMSGQQEIGDFGERVFLAQQGSRLTRRMLPGLQAPVRAGDVDRGGIPGRYNLK